MSIRFNGRLKCLTVLIVESIVEEKNPFHIEAELAESAAELPKSGRAQPATEQRAQVLRT